MNWENNSSPLFKEYQLLMANDINNQTVIDIIGTNDVIETQISGISLYQGTWFWINVIDDWDCGILSESAIIENIEKEYQLSRVALGKDDVDQPIAVKIDKIRMDISSWKML